MKAQYHARERVVLGNEATGRGAIRLVDSQEPFVELGHQHSMPNATPPLAEHHSARQASTLSAGSLAAGRAPFRLRGEACLLEPVA